MWGVPTQTCKVWPLPTQVSAHLQGIVRELIQEAGREGGACLLLDAATPRDHLPAAKVGGDGGSRQGMVSQSGAEKEETMQVSGSIPQQALSLAHSTRGYTGRELGERASRI